MKAFWKSFGLTLFILLFLVYGLADWSDRSSKGEESTPVQDKQVHKETELAEQHSLPPALGKALWINQPIQAIWDLLGKPQLSVQVSPNRRIEQFYQEEGHFISLEVVNERIVSVTVLGAEDTSGLFTVGMTRANVTDEMPLQKVVDLVDHGKSRQLDLTKQERRYIPIVPFDNKTYAILLFEKASKQVAGVVYVAADELSSLNVYEDNRPKNLPSEIKGDQVDASLLNQVWLNCMNALRRQKGLSDYQTDPLVVEEASQILKTVKANPEKQLYSSATVETAVRSIYLNKPVAFLFNQQFQSVYSNLINLFKEQDHMPVFGPHNDVKGGFAVLDSDGLWVVQANEEGVRGQ